MRFRFTIARKLVTGFGILTIAMLISSTLTFITLNKSKMENLKITNIYAPSAAYLGELSQMINNSKLLIKNWVYVEQTPNTPDKTKLVQLHEIGYPDLDEKLTQISRKWDTQTKDAYKKLSATIKDTLFVYHKIVMDRLSTFENYDDPMVMFEVQPMVEEGGEIMVYTDKVLARLAKLIEKQDKIVTEARAKMIKSFDTFQRSIIFMGIILLVSVLLIAFLTIRALVRPINYMKKILLSMSKGIIPEEKIRESTDEIGEMAIALNLLITSLKEISSFALEIGKGNFNMEFTPLSDKDRLGLSLIEMRNNLRKADQEEEKRKKENAERGWTSHGIALFSDILRQNNDDIAELSYQIISNIAKYLQVEQGGIFLIQEPEGEEPYVEMMACFAYDRKKSLQKKIGIQEGLIGHAIQEKETIYLSDIPADYINITSGLGNEKPGFLLIVPLVMTDKPYGAIELASFKAIESYKIEFVQRLGESIASTYASLKNTLQTAYLLEKTRQQAEEMASKEEEMRQNMEELQATQEDYLQREDDYKKEIEQLRKIALHKGKE